MPKAKPVKMEQNGVTFRHQFRVEQRPDHIIDMFNNPLPSLLRGEPYNEARVQKLSSNSIRNAEFRNISTENPLHTYKDKDESLA